MDCFQNWTEQYLGQDLLGDQTEFDIDLYMTFTINELLTKLTF